MIHRIENERLIIEVNETGAELYSLKSKKTGTEYLWQGNPEYWEGRSPILFPICGRLFGGRYVYEDKTY
ncbi:MAG: aldose 1-epimerase family protein, partial [Clostridia bacterium]|nr:aldose 1-epimerase family protein [Clostridia bacterium]